MPKSRKLTSEQPQDINPQEQAPQNEYVNDKINDFMGDFDPKFDDWDENQATSEQPVEQQPVTPPTTETPKSPELDVDGLKAQLREEVGKEVSDRILNVIKGQSAEEQSKFITDVLFLKEGRAPKNWEEITDAAADEGAKRALKMFEEQQAAKEAQLKDEEKRIQEEQETINKQWNSYWDMQLDELTANGKIPPMSPQVKQKWDTMQQLSEDDQKDPGVKARLMLFDLASKNKNTSLKEVYYDFYIEEAKKFRQPAGADAPVSAGRGGKPESSESFSYEDIHNAKGYHDLFKR